MKKYMTLFIFALILPLSWGCRTDHAISTGIKEIGLDTPDYSQISSWVFQAESPDKPVDVFYVYPTIYAGDSPANMDIQDAELRSSAGRLMDAQANVYAENANVFAPFYRQMSLAKLNPGEDMYQNPYYQIGYGDVRRAFAYYLENLNGGRPFILAGHSQGSMVLISLMRELFHDPGLQQKLVAAYLIGYSVTQNDFKNYPWMKPATGFSDTGVIISFNTQTPGATGSPVLLPGAFCINPLTWTTEDTPADKSLNLGAVFFNSTTGDIEREIPNYAGARVDKATGALVTELPEDLDTDPFPQGVYHKYDYALWYRNLEKNIEIRCRSYLEQADN
jgi:hypothetical protein